MNKDRSDKLTPMMKQYQEIKSRNPDHILFYRLGDFYEMFFDDAVTASRILNLTLTTRGKHLETEIPLAGFPHHQIDNYLARMVKAGYKVAICDQTEDPKHAKGIVKRDITEIVTAGTALSENILSKDANNYIAAVSAIDNKRFGFAAADISSGEFVACDTTDLTELKEIIMQFDPSEVITHIRDHNSLFSNKMYVTEEEKEVFFSDTSVSMLKEHSNISSLSSLGFDENDLAPACAGVLIGYIRENIKSRMPELERLKRYDAQKICSVDHRTRRNLEILEPAATGGNKKATLYSVMNKTKTPMGSRLMRKWLTNPLKDSAEICRRLDITEILVKNNSLREGINEILSLIGDTERLSGKLSINRIRPDELLRLRDYLNLIPKLKELLTASREPELNSVGSSFADSGAFTDLINKSIAESETKNSSDKCFIKRGFSKDLDRLYDITLNGKDKILQLSSKVKKELGIPGLKTGYNKIFGYYFETTKKYSDMIPDHYIRKQTLVNSERFINEELKLLEEEILSADEKINDLVLSLYEEIKANARDHCSEIKINSQLVASIDCLCSFAAVAVSDNFTRPEFSSRKELVIDNGRHPVVEKFLAAGEDYIPNSLVMTEDGNIHIITGPNMSGKSTYLRQTAIIVLLAQAGCFVPADKAVIGMTDKIFTRVGASDDLSGGESTFLMEMNETANILNNATPDSLIIFDEVGRGTATFDGLSLAWSIIEYIHDQPRISSRTLFATHYHELTEIEKICSRVRNFHASVKEHGKEIIFMRKIEKGAADNSYGIYVAKLAGIPEKILKRAEVILKNLEENELTPDSKPVIARDKEKSVLIEQPGLFSTENDILREKLRSLQINTMTPLEAMINLEKLKDLV